MQKQIVRREGYIYTGSCNLAASSNGQISFQVSSQFSFFFTKFSYVAKVHVANAIPSFDFQISKNEYNLFYDYAASDLFAGMTYDTSTTPDTRYPVGMANWFHYDQPFPFEAKSNILINLRETAGNATIVRFALAGYKEIYREM